MEPRSVLSVFTEHGRSCAIPFAFEPDDDVIEALLDARFREASWTHAVLRRGGNAIAFEHLGDAHWARAARSPMRVAVRR